MWLPFVCFFCLCCCLCFLLFFFFFLSLLCLFLATMSFADFFFLVRVFSLLSLLVFSEIVPGLIWFSSVYLVTTARFVADQLM